MSERPGRVLTIVCAVDDSERALAFAEAGAWLSRELGGRVVARSRLRPPEIPMPLTKELRLAGMTPQHITDLLRS
jgi:hypothetical protein